MLDPLSLADGNPYPRSVRWLAAKPLRTFLSSVLLLGVLPLAAFLGIGWSEKTLVLPDPRGVGFRGLLASVEIGGKGDRGVLEDVIFLSCFLMWPFFLLLIVPAYRAVVRALGAAPAYLLEAGGDPTGRGITREEIAALRAYIGSVLRGGMKPLDGEHPAALERLGLGDARRALRVLRWVAYGVATLFWLTSMHHHWNAVTTYGFRIWADSGYLAGFVGRALYEAVAYIGVAPILCMAVLRLLYVVFRIPLILEEMRAIRYIPYPWDDAGHLGVYGIASLMLMGLIAPILLPLLTYVFTYPVTPVLVLGMVTLTLLLPTVFFLPLLSIHRVMKDLRRHELESLEAGLDRIYWQVRDAMQHYDLKEDPEVAHRALEALEEARSLFNHTFNANIWPFRRKVMAAVITGSTVLATTIGSRLFGS